VPRFFRAQRGPAVAFAIVLSALALVFALALGVLLSVGTGNPATRAIHALTEDPEFREEAARYFVDALSEGADGDASQFLSRNEAAVTAVLADLIGSESFTRELDAISESARAWFVDGDPASRRISIAPPVSQMVDVLERVDPQFGVLREGLADLDRLDLADDGADSPELGRIINIVLLVTLALLALLAAVGVGYARVAASANGATRTFGALAATIGVVLVGIWLVATRVAETAASAQDEALARIAIPTAAAAVVAPIRTLGTAWIVAGAALVVASVVRGRRGATV